MTVSRNRMEPSQLGMRCATCTERDEVGSVASGSGAARSAALVVGAGAGAGAGGRASVVGSIALVGSVGGGALPKPVAAPDDGVDERGLAIGDQLPPQGSDGDPHRVRER